MFYTFFFSHTHTRARARVFCPYTVCVLFKCARIEITTDQLTVAEARHGEIVRCEQLWCATERQCRTEAGKSGQRWAARVNTVFGIKSKCVANDPRERILLLISKNVHNTQLPHIRLEYDTRTHTHTLRLHPFVMLRQQAAPIASPSSPFAHPPRSPHLSTACCLSTLLRRLAPISHATRTLTQGVNADPPRMPLLRIRVSSKNGKRR